MSNFLHFVGGVVLFGVLCVFTYYFFLLPMTRKFKRLWKGRRGGLPPGALWSPKGGQNPTLPMMYHSVIFGVHDKREYESIDECERAVVDACTSLGLSFGAKIDIVDENGKVVKANVITPVRGANR